MFASLSPRGLSAGVGRHGASVALALGLTALLTTVHPAAATSHTLMRPAAPAYPVTITNCGVATTYTQAPRRVVTTFDTTSEILLKLGLGDRIVGTYYAPKYHTEPDIDAAYHRQHVLGGAMGAPSREAVLAVHPDFVFAEAPSVDFVSAMGEPSQAQLTAAGANIYALSGECTTGAAVHARVADIYADILTIGRIFDVEPRAQSLVNAMQARVAAVRRRIAGRPLVGVVGYVSGMGPLTVIGRGMYTDLMLQAGGRNVFGGVSTTYASVSRETFAAANADVYVSARYVGAMGGMMGPQSDTAKSRFLFSTFPHTNASLNRRFVGIDGDVWNAGIRTPEAIELLARASHPEAFR